MDYCTGKKINLDKPEERIRQEYERILCEDYDYNKQQIDIEVPLEIGLAKKNADIVIYKTSNASERNQDKDILGIIETKKLEKKDGIEQLSSYMAGSSCEWGVWTNGKEIEYLYKSPQGKIQKDFLFNIPLCGQSISDMGHESKQQLKPVKNLKPIFRRILNVLYSNTNISRKEKLGSEMIKLIFCKIFDEKNDLESDSKFKNIPGEDVEKTKKRILSLFKEVKEELVEDGVFAKNEEITLDAKSISYVVGELESFSLLKTEKDTVGEAFETFAESKLVGEKGEFFTPREVVKTAIQILDPEIGSTIIDPACGSGGFLIYALEHVWRKMEQNPKYKDAALLKQEKTKIAETCFYGLDKEMDLVKIAKAYMSIVSDGKSKICQENSLHAVKDFNPKVKEVFTEDGAGEQLKQFDFVVTNPPFGSKIKVLKGDSKHFDLGHIWKSGKKTNKVQETAPQELFIERCLQLLKPGGKLAIVLPETYFHAVSKKYILEYARKNNNILAVIDLPHNTFRPYCNAKGCLLILEKDRPQQEMITMAVAEEIGHDHTGRPIYRYDDAQKSFDKESIWDDTQVIREELKQLGSKNNKYTFLVPSNEIVNDIYVPRYYWNKKEEEIKIAAAKEEMELVSIQELIENGIVSAFKGHGSPPSEYKGIGEIPYVRVADIVNWQVYKNPTSSITPSIYETIKGKNGVDLKELDILFVRRGSYRIGSVALLSEYDTDILICNELTVFRINNPKNEYAIDAYYFLFALSHSITQMQIDSKVFIDTTLPNIADRWSELKIPIFKDKKKLASVSKKVQEVFEQRKKAFQEINSLSNQFGQLTT